jgi:hypothetical protein
MAQFSFWAEAEAAKISYKGKKNMARDKLIVVLIISINIFNF